MDNIITERIIFTTFNELNEDEKKIIGDSWANPFNARYNGMKDPYGSVLKLSQQTEPTFNNLKVFDDCMYFKVVRDKESGEIIGTCRYGKYYFSEDELIWDFGFNVILKHWHKGYGVEILSKIVNIAKNYGVKTIIGRAYKENYGSYKVMIRNGFQYAGIDNDGDYRYTLDLSKEPISSDEMNKIWNEHLFMTKNDFGKDTFQRLEYVNNKIVEMVRRIQEGEDEEKLVKEYFEKLNEIEEFTFC